MSGRNSLGKLISARRKSMKLTQAELSEKIGVSKSAVAKWETDGGIPSIDNLGKISKILGLSIADLHRTARGQEPEAVVRRPDITEDVIAVLESCGYKVVPPDTTDGKQANAERKEE